MVTPIAAVAILQQATALISFCCTLWDDVIVPGAVPPLVHLQSLIIRDVDGLGDNLFQDPQRLLLNALTTPALHHLSFSERELGIESISTITSFLSRSHCPLDSLHVTRSSLSEADYCAAFPSIELSMGDSDDESREEDEGASDSSLNLQYLGHRGSTDLERMSLPGSTKFASYAK
jgi:hypothetical protein